MKYNELIVLLPCHSLEDFPTHPEGDEAHSLLVSWTALWHPELIAAAGQAPTWRRVEEPPSEVAGKLIVVPASCVSRLPTGYAQRVKDEGGVIIRKTAIRDEVVGTALAGLGEDRQTPVKDDLAADFLALGYGYLMVGLLTRQMRYSSNLDEPYFKSQVLAAAQAAAQGDEPLAREKLSACFSLLAEERDHYYPVDAYILDLGMVASSTLGASLRDLLSDPAPKNLLLAADLLAEMQTKEPQTLDLLRTALAEGRVGILGGEGTEQPLPLLSQDDALAELRRGLALYEQHLGKRPEVFGRWRFGLTPNLPATLLKLGFRGCLHATFEEGTVPTGSQLKVRWEGLDGTAIDAICRSPLDASKPQTFLQLPTKMGESMDQDHVATLMLASWPGQASPWLADLRRIANYCSALGKFVTINDYFKNSALPGQLDRFEADRYRSPYLKQAVIRKQADPISSQVRYQEQVAEKLACSAMQTLASSITGKPPGNSTEATETSLVARQLADALVGTATAKTPTAELGTLVLNPCSFVRRVGLQLPSDTVGLPTVAKPVYAAAEYKNQKHAVLDVPPLGFVWLPQNNPAANRGDANSLLLADDCVLRNEFFEATINPTTGAVKSITGYQSRGNRFSQQLALRMPGLPGKPGEAYRDPDETATYSVMAADKIEITAASTTVGELTIQGRLLDLQGKTLANYTQVVRAYRGSRVLQFEVELDPQADLKADPWNSYFCSRFAWPEEDAEVFRTTGGTRQPAESKRLEAPHYIEVCGAKNNTTILTAGLPYHRRQEGRMLDSILITRGETARRFKFGIGIDLTHPMLEAASLLSPVQLVPGVQRPASGASGWLFHLDARNVVVSHWEPYQNASGQQGIRVRLLETAGRPAALSLSGFRPFVAAEQVDFLGQKIKDCDLEGGKIRLDMAAHEWLEVVANW